jgi:hypothetical protein
MTAVGVPTRPPRRLVLPTDGCTGSVSVTAVRRWGLIALALPGAGLADMDWDAWRVLVVRVWVLGFDSGASRDCAFVVRWLRLWMGLECDCSSILLRAGSGWDVYDVNCSTACAEMTKPYNDTGGGNGSHGDSPGSAAELFSIASRSIQQASWCCDQVSQSFPRSMLFPTFSRKHLSVTTTIPLRQRVRATFMRG